MPPGLLFKAVRCAVQMLLTHLKSLPLEGILHSSSLGGMSFLKGPIRAHRLSKSWTQAFSTCQGPWEEEKPRCNPLWERGTGHSGTCEAQGDP